MIKARTSLRGGSRNLKGGVLFIVVVSWSLPTTPTFYCFLGKMGVLPSFENTRRTRALRSTSESRSATQFVQLSQNSSC